MARKFVLFFCFVFLVNEFCDANEDAKRLLDDLLSNYNSLIRPVEKPTDEIKLYLGLKLSQIADIDEKNQIMTTNVWIRHEWYDYKLQWNLSHYGNIDKLNVPSSNIWLPDICFADGDYQITTKTKATVYYNGRVVWEPPMIYKSYCSIDIEYYPFDVQKCYFKFGSWTNDGSRINLEHLNEKNAVRANNVTNRDGPTKLYTVESGIDMSDYYTSVEWDVLAVPAQKNIKYYLCCPEPYYDIYFNITIRRKTLFYTVNLIIPCVNISFLSVLVFFLPSDSGEKLTLGISILVALLVFYLLLIELIPPTSLVIPLIGKYLLFTLILVNVSILLTIFILNMFHRKPQTHKMPNWMKVVFIQHLPKILMIQRPIDMKPSASQEFDSTPNNLRPLKQERFTQYDNRFRNYNIRRNEKSTTSLLSEVNAAAGEVVIKYKEKYPRNILTAIEGLKYINKQMEKDNKEKKEIDDWKYVSMVVDRLLLWIFTVACFVGTCWILLQAPSIYDERKPLGRTVLNYSDKEAKSCIT